MMFAPLLLLAAASATAPLKIGDTLPVVAGETLSGNRITLPPAAAGNAAVLVFSFSRTGGNDARVWNDHLAAEAVDRRVPSFTVMMLESVPRILRGLVASSIRKQVPVAMHERSTIIFRDEAIWKQRLTATDDRRAYVLLLDSEARIRWMSAGRFSDSAFAQLREAVLRVLPRQK